MTRPISSPPAPRVLLVEGRDDERVVRQLSARHQPTPAFSILAKTGIDPLLKSIGPEIRVSGRQVVGILVDANNNLMARWDAVTSRLSKENIESCVSSSPDGTIMEVAGKPRIGIWLMPDNTSAGNPEHFVKQMIPDSDPVWPLSQRYIQGIPEADRQFAATKTMKAKVHAWLATREEPGRRMSTAILAHDLEVDGALSRKFVAWLTRLFG